MRCPTCKKEFFPQPDNLKFFWSDDDEDSSAVVGFLVQQCPSCREVMVIRQEGQGGRTGTNLHISQVEKESVIYPRHEERLVPQEVPDCFREDLIEAASALQYSAKASAALSRRLLQRVLREVLEIRRRDLSLEIDEFIQLGGAPTYLADAVDAVRQIGNFAAHPIKSTSTGEIVEVEAGEAEWLLEVLDSLFDFAFVQPVRLNQRRDALNKKLAGLGKPALKGSTR